jgi:PAS domain S-box-containing protein
VTTSDDENELLRSVALQNANSILVARQRAERRSEAYLAEAQRLSHTGSFGWRPSTGEVLWSEETFRIFQYDRTTKPTMELVLQRVHPEDAAFVKQTIERASQDGRNFDHEYRLVMPEGSVKQVHVVAHALSDESGDVEFVGAVTDTTESKRAQEALRRSESNLAEAQRLTHTGSWVWQVARRDALHLSEEWYRIYGFDAEEGMPAWEERLRRIHPEDRAKWQGIIDRAIGEKSDYAVEFRILLPDGTVKYIHSVGHPVFDASGDLAEFVGSATDITDRKRAEVLLAGEKRLLEMIARGDARGLILDSACLLVEELSSGSLSSILLLDPSANCLRHGAAPSLPITYTEAINGAVIGPSVGSCGTAAYRAEPVIVSDIATDPLWTDYRDLAWAHELRACWSTPILSSAGRVLGTFATYYREPRSPSLQEINVIERITHLVSIAIERKLAEGKLRQSEAHLFEAQRLSHTGSIFWNVASGEVGWSDEIFRIFEYDLTRTPSIELHYQRIHPDDRALVQQTQDRQTNDGIDIDIEYRLLMPDGRVKHLRAVAHPLHDSSGNLEYVTAFMDMTATKQGQEALRQAQADLAHVSRVTTMGELTASLAHEVNQPIAAAVTNANACLRWLAANPPNVEEARAAVMRIVKDGKRGAEIINRVRLLFQKGTPQREWVDVNEVIREMIVLLRSEATRYNISVRTELAADLPQVMGDRVQLQQVMMNLIMNGIDAMKAVDGERELAIKSQRAENEEVVVSVTDTGVGLPPQQADQIFDAFFSTKPHGTGMGLRISRSILESHGGRLWAGGNSPRGASFCFTLPTKTEAKE